MSGERFKYVKTIFQQLEAKDVGGARDEIIDLVRRTTNGCTMYFDGLGSLGTAAILRSIAHELRSMKDPPPELCFGRIIYIDCSTWKSKRVMQRRIAEGLNLDHKTMDMFDKEDEEDDFSGVDPASRDEIRDVAAVIARILRICRSMIIFLNGSDEDVVLSRFGVPEYNDNIIIWTFRRRFPAKGLRSQYPDNTKEIASKLRHTKVFIYGFSWDGTELRQPTRSELSEMVREEAASVLARHPCMQEDDLDLVIDCYLYVLFLHHTSFYKGTRCLWTNHGANYWMCDGIIQGDRTRDISKALYQEVNFECDDASFDSNEFKEKSWYQEVGVEGDDASFDSNAFKEEMTSPYLVFGDDCYFSSRIIGKRPGRWISITSKNKIIGEKMKSILANASSIILAFESTNSPHGLPNDLMEQCNNLRVLILSYCAFNFLSPLFRHCQTLRFLGLDHCRNNHTAELEREEYTTKWACLHSLWVLDLRYTDWGEIVSQENMDLMGNIMELNIEGFMCHQFTSQLEGRLPNLERLRIVKPLHPAEASKDIDNSFVGKAKLEVLDLSGNNDMKKLPTSLSKASNLQVLVLDGCDGLENVVLANPLLRSFSFDGYGPAHNWTSIVELSPESSRPKCPSNADKKKDVKTSVISLEGCTQLENLFLRGLPNLEELDLSGCAIKILDLETMVMDVPRLKRLFLLGCEHLRAIRWGSYEDKQLELELLCIDTRPGRVPGCARPSIAHSKSFGLQVHAITADARFARSLWIPIVKSMKTLFIDIHITSSNIYGERSSEEMSKLPCDQKHHVVPATRLYNDVFNSDTLTLIEAFPMPPSSQLDRHIEIGEGSRNVGGEVEFYDSYVGNLNSLMNAYIESLHVHDTSASTAMASTYIHALKWCRVERCHSLDPVFPRGAYPKVVETIWASHLLMARCIWSKGSTESNYNFARLRHLHLRSCPSLQFALPVWTSSFNDLETLYVIHCGSLKHIFELNKDYKSSMVLFPKLTTIHLHDVPALRQICEVKMHAPALETIMTRGCWSLRQLPALEGRRPGLRRPSVEMEKDVWDALEWDGVDAGEHHPSLYQAPVHSRHYKKQRLLRGTVLRYVSDDCSSSGYIRQLFS
ncbi:hypothetical protein EJB05_10208 [Eragrostis curvula]|uniref:Disease resistance protein At4g27190-like leucine-rich repeats domain-containing protein n=1 Tax=Eragrostis curvula TaxID=38414 RepID=A0A5J9W8J8_9POAL|nr:hypothetical protein EJB05_10208 [Eragrostis curvula]